MMMVSDVGIERPILHCCLCGHSGRLHNDEGCIATRCDCWLTRDQVRFLELQRDDAGETVEVGAGT